MTFIRSIGLLVKIKQLVAEIVDLAFQIIQPYLKQVSLPITRCGCHDNACIKDVLGPRYDGPDLNYQSSSGTWPTLPADQAKQFLRTPEARILGKNCHVYKILGSENDPYGRLWLLDYRIDSRSFWREEFAVLETWNSDEQYVDFLVPEEHGIKVWMGEAASQQVTENCILLPPQRLLACDLTLSRRQLYTNHNKYFYKYILMLN